MLGNTASRQHIEPIALPVLEDYDVSPLTGFAPHPQPLARLTQPYYQPWEEIMDQLNHLINSRQLRSRVDQMPLLDVDLLETRPEQQRAASLLGIMAHSYVWGNGLDIAQSIPESLAVPWQAVSDKVNVPSVLTYAANNLWNWKLKDPQGPYTIENLETLATMTDTYDETWFDIVSVAIELEGGAPLQLLLDAMNAVREDDMETVIAKLHAVLPCLERIGKVLPRMFEKCDPAVFFWKIRKFLSGSENMAALGLPDGLEFKGVNGNERKHLMGATGGQTSLFPALDLIFGIDHHEKSLEKNTPNVLLLKMKAYMPGPHRAFLDHLSKVANLRAYVQSKSSSDESDRAKELVEAFDACVHKIKLFRDSHIQVVTRYIVTQSKRGPPEGWEDYRVQVPAVTSTTGQAPEKQNAEKKDGNDEEPAIQGTGGSDLMPFLKNSRDETNAAKLQATIAKK